MFCAPWYCKVGLNYCKKLVFKRFNLFRLVTHISGAVLHANFFAAYVLRIMPLVLEDVVHLEELPWMQRDLAHLHTLPPKYLCEIYVIV